jgi:hypothetical protein
MNVWELWRWVEKVAAAPHRLLLAIVKSYDARRGVCALRIGEGRMLRVGWEILKEHAAVPCVWQKLVVYLDENGAAAKLELVGER